MRVKPEKLIFATKYYIAILLIQYWCRTTKCATYLLRCGSLDWYWTGILQMLWLLCRDTSARLQTSELFYTTVAVKHSKVTHKHFTGFSPPKQPV